MQYAFRGIVMFLTLLAAGPALAAAECAELTALQRWAGYVSWLNFFKGFGALMFAAGFIYLFKGILAQVIHSLRSLLEVLGYALSFALIAAGWVVGPQYLIWTALTGSILFGGMVFVSLAMHTVRNINEKSIALFLMVIWGAVAIMYNMPSVGILSVMALMAFVGFFVVATPLVYIIGFESEKSVPTGTLAALVVLIGFLGVYILMPNAPAYISVFNAGAFWVSSFVAFTGLLIMSSSFYSSGGHYLYLQVVTLAVLGVSIMLGMIFGLNPLAGTAGVFLALYLAEKPWDVRDHVGVSLTLIISGGFMFCVWYLAIQNEELVRQYLTTTL